MSYDDPTALAAAETYLIHVLTDSTPPGDPSDYQITEAAQAFHAERGTYDLEAAGPEVAKELLARHAK